MLSLTHLKIFGTNFALAVTSESTAHNSYVNDPENIK